MKRVLPVVVCILASYVSLTPKQVSALDQVGSTGSALGFSGTEALSTVEASVLLHSLPMLTLLDGGSLPISNALGRMGTAPLGLFPASYLEADVPRPSARRQRYESDGSGKLADLRLPEYYYGGEAGVFYGRSTGKYGAEQFGSYFMGTVGNDKVQVTAGASYQESTFHFQRGGR